MNRICLMKRLLLILLLISFLSGCAHRPQPIKEQILQDPTVEQRYKDAIRQGRVIPGMTHGMVEAIYGPPHAVNYSTFDDGTQAEVWVYQPSLARQAISARYGLSTQYLYIAFKEDKVVRVLNDIRTPNVIVIPK